MINSMQKALIKKDLRQIVSNKRLFPVLLLIPIIFTVVLPTIFILMVVLSPIESSDFQELLKLLPADMLSGDITQALLSYMLNNMMPLFFLLIPIMSASVMAASSFVGEKEKRTLETLLYSPLTLRQIFNAKILASFFLSMAVSFASFAMMVVVFEAEILIFTSSWLIPNISWLITMLLVSPAISLIAIVVIVRGSAKAQTMEESQQRSAFLILPIILLAASQFTGILMISVWILLALGIVLTVIAILSLKSSFSRFNYETLLK